MTTAGVSNRMSLDGWLEHDVPDGYRVELVDGEVVMVPWAAYSHEKVLFNLDRIFILYSVDHPGVIKTVMRPARLPIPGSDEGRQPDLALYDSEPQHPDSPDAWKEIRPFLVVEVVSPKQESRDYIDKYASYHQAQVPEYWIVDPRERRVLALRWTPERWEHHPLGESDRYSTPLLPGLALEVATLWL